MYNGLSLNNSRDIIANSIHLIQGNVITDILDIIAQNGADTNAIITALLADQNFINAIAASATNSYTKTESDNLYYSKTSLDNLLVAKQNIINDGDLTIAKTNGLQTQLNLLQSSVLANAASILTKQNNIADGDLTIAKTNGLQSALDLKRSIANSYSKTDIDTTFTNYYSKVYTDAMFANYYLKTDIDTTFGNYYLKTDIDTTFGNYYLKTVIDTTFNNYYLKTAIDATFGNYYLKTDIDTTFGNYYLKTAIDTTFTNYYSKTYIDAMFTNYYLKTDIDTTFTNYYSKTYIDTNFYNRTYIDALPPLQVYYNNAAWLDTAKIDFTNSTITTHSNPTHIQVKATPALADISDITAVAQNVSFGRPITHILNNDPGLGVEASFQYIMTSTMYHQVSARFDNTSDADSYIRWYVRDTNGNLRQAFQVRADKAMNIYGNLYGTSATFTGTVNADSMTLQNTGAVALILKADTDNSGGSDNPLLRFQQDGTTVYTDIGLADAGNNFYINWGADGSTNSQYFVIQHGSNRDFEIDRWHKAKLYGPLTVSTNGNASSSEIDVMYFKNQSGAQQHKIMAGFHSTSPGLNRLRFLVQDHSGTSQHVMVMGGDKNVSFYGNVTVSGLVYATAYGNTSDKSVKDDIKDIDLTPIFDNCNVKSYNRTDKPELGKRVGFIAQDIQKSCTDNNLPNTFNQDIPQEDNTTLLGLDYSRLVTVLWSKVKQLEQRIAVLENK